MDECYGMIVQASGRGFTGGRIYDALLLRCAAKIKADVIHTWNTRHFLDIDPKLEDRIQTP